MARKAKQVPIIEVFEQRKRWRARKRLPSRRRLVALKGASYSTRMNARRAARREYPGLPIVSV